MTVHIGTSGWQYRDWRGPVYPHGLPQVRWLEAYAASFSTVESNAAFYRLPERRTFEAWAARTPPDFTMAVKASRYLTHVLRLRDPEEPVGRLVERAAGLGTKLGPILVQLPPSFEADTGRLDATLGAFPRDWLVAVEVRDPSWDQDAVCRILRRRGAALCLADRRGPLEPRWRTADWTYLRFHQGRATPRPCYGERALEGWARRLLDGWGAGAEAWVYFNNDHRACAPSDALRFADRCRGLGMAVARTAPPETITRPI
jgi:uncharacterized protein YecE (DUF72 family)